MVAWNEDRSEEGVENPAAALMLHEGGEGGRTSRVSRGLGGWFLADLILGVGKDGEKTHESRAVGDS